MNIDYQSNLKAALDARTTDWARPLPAPARTAALVAAGLLAALFVASAAYAMYRINQLPDSVGRAADPQLWKRHFGPQLTASRVALLAVGGALALLAIARWDRTVRLMRGAWLAVGHPMNLAVYRIVLFATILFNLDNDHGYTQVVYFAGLPKELFVPPTGMEHLLKADWFLALINPTVAWWALTLMYVFCVTAILGLFTRTSAWLVLILGVFATGIPQYFGQTNHYHHMFWFASILAVSRCGDHLSVDAVLAARRRATRTGVTAPPPAAWGYALPLRFVWVLLGICYFFPGLWKYWNAGLAWAFSDHFKHLAEWKWINMGLEMKDGKWVNDWHPLFRLDQYPLMYKPAALTAIVFELGFMFAIFFPRAKYVAIAMGVGFHRMIALTMRIPFFTLQTSYVSLIEWDRFFSWLGRKRGIEFAYDGTNPSARRSVATLRALDLIGNVQYRDDAPADVGARTTVKGATLTGAAALRALAARNPVLWLVWPLVYLLPDPAARRGGAAPVDPGAAAGRAFATPALAPLLVMAAVVILPNLYLGAKRQYHGWPWACYPLFEKIRTHTKPDFDVVALDADGRVIHWNERHMMDLLTRPRYATMCRRVREKQDPAQLHAFWKMLVGENQELKDAKVVQFRIRTRLSAPEQFATAEPVKDDLVYQARVTPDGIVADPTATLTPMIRSARTDE